MFLFSMLRFFDSEISDLKIPGFVKEEIGQSIR